MVAARSGMDGRGVAERSEVKKSVFFEEPGESPEPGGGREKSVAAGRH